MRLVRSLLPVIVAVGLIPLAAGPALAAAPGNDEAAGATAIPSNLPQTTAEDTTEATLGADDVAETANGCFGIPPTKNSVWFTYTPTVSGGVLVDVTQSDFSAGVVVFEGTPASDGSNFQSCGAGEAGIDAQAGTTYYIMAFGDGGLSGTDPTGGNLSMTLTSAPTPTAHVTLAKKGKAFHGGAAELHGSYKCTHDDAFSELDVALTQRAGRLKIKAFGGALTQCDGKKHQWSARLVSDYALFAKGHGKAKISFFSCGVVDCAIAHDKGKVKLSWASGTHRAAWMKHPTHLPSVRPHAAVRSHPTMKYWSHR